MKNPPFGFQKAGFSTIYSAGVERDGSCGSDVHFVRDVCLRQVKAEHITSLCGTAAIHHCAARHNITCANGANIMMVLRALMNNGCGIGNVLL